ncbi:MAG: glycosyltransferase family 4 protein [Pseudodesulfovibrio sp.]|nr:glycosyltransferase family 4 protein [Pseudodesulfovibrio sp.]
MKIVLLTPSGVSFSSTRFRMIPYVEIGRQEGVDVWCEQVPRDFLRRCVFFSRLPKADVIVVFRELLSFHELKMVKRLCHRLVYDFDEAVWTRPPHVNLRGNERRITKAARRFRRVCAEADLCIAGNRYLADTALQHQDTVRIVSTVMDTEAYIPGSGGNEGGTVLVGWMGESRDVSYLNGPMKQLGKHAGRIQFLVISDTQYSGPAKEYVFWSTWSEDKEISQLQRMDIGMVPLFDNEYTRGDCGALVLRYMACGVPVIASDVGANSEIVDHGIDGFLVKDRDDWAKCAMRLTEDSRLRQNMAEAARGKVVAKYGLSQAVQQLRDVLEVE